jgi:uncharacterized membrane protein
MKHPDKNPLRNNEEFQLERLAFFSDAVFAIAITLLVIEIKVPEVESEHISDGILLNKLAYIIPKFIGVIISFFVIGLYWISHHRLFGYITRYDKRLLWPNLLFLVTIIFMPFSTAFLSEYYNPSLRVPLLVYAININFTGMMSYRLWSIATSSKYNLSVISNNRIVKQYNLVRALTIPLTFLLILLLSVFSGWIPFLLLPFMPVISYFIKRYYKKKYPSFTEEHLG